MGSAAQWDVPTAAAPAPSGRTATPRFRRFAMGGSACPAVIVFPRMPYPLRSKELILRPVPEEPVNRNQIRRRSETACGDVAGTQRCVHALAVGCRGSAGASSPARRRAAARRGQGGLGPGQGVPRDDAHPRADLHQRPVALAAGRARRDERCRPATGAISRCPGCWPGISDYMQKDCQTVYAHPSWKDEKLGERHRGLVPARDQRARGVGRPPHRAVGWSTSIPARPSTSTARRRAKCSFPAAKWT